MVFFDNILVYSKSLEEHLSHLYEVLTILSTNRMFVKETKCNFGVRMVDYLGLLISYQGVAVGLSKIKAILEWPTSTVAKGVCRFLGLARYYQKLSNILE